MRRFPVVSDWSSTVNIVTSPLPFPKSIFFLFISVFFLCVEPEIGKDRLKNMKYVMPCALVTPRLFISINAIFKIFLYLTHPLLHPVA